MRLKLENQHGRNNFPVVTIKYWNDIKKKKKKTYSCALHDFPTTKSTDNGPATVVV
jgi:hypothetical protein